MRKEENKARIRASDRQSPEIIYIQSVGHSGSTLLSRLVNLHPDIFSMGSFRELELEPGEVEDTMCGCGRHPAVCEVWSGISSDYAERGVGRFRGRDGRVNEEQFDRSSAVINILGRTTNSSHVCELTHDGRRVAGYVSRIPERVVLVHLVRDPRAIFRSYMRLLKPTTKRGHSGLALRIARYYFRRHAYTLYLRVRYQPKGLRYIRVRYEDVCENPDEELARIFQKSGVANFIVSANFKHERNHIIGGNVIRFKPLHTVKDQRRFMIEFSGLRYLGLTLLNLPFLLGFRYPIFRTKRR